MYALRHHELVVYHFSQQADEPAPARATPRYQRVIASSRAFSVVEWRQPSPSSEYRGGHLTDDDLLFTSRAQKH